MITRGSVKLSVNQLAQYQRDGFLVLDNFVDGASCNRLGARAEELVRQFDPQDLVSVFSTQDQSRISDDYFLESGGKIRFFFEEHAFLHGGTLKQAIPSNCRYPEDNWLGGNYQMARAANSKEVCQGAKRVGVPKLIKPMLATLVDEPFSDPDWLFETKWDGVRAVCFIRNGKARFISRNQNELTGQYPELAHIAQSIRGSSVILDGEIVALDENGVSRFQLLQRRLGRKNAGEIERLAATTRIAFYVFDLLYLDGFDLMGCKLIDRKETLEQIFKPSKNVRYSDHIIGEGEKLFEEVAKVPLEGMIAKRLESTYVQRRSAEWLKIKTIQQSEVVIGGYTQPRNSREYFGALVVGLYRDGKLHYVAHTGGGFNHRTLAQTYKLMQPLKTRDCPFVEKPKTNELVQWVKPKLVAQVKFSEWTADQRMRHPVFLGLRTDKKPEECVFEIKRDTDQVLTKGARKTKR